MKVPFSISARTAKLIGLENFANAEGAIVELVKNSYDADAGTCVVVLDIKENVKLSNIYVFDDGSGMTKDTIISHWMTIGTNDKLLNAFSSGLNRIKSGAKGIGRFALNRLGKEAKMATFTKECRVGQLWNVDWSQFENASILSEIEASIDDIHIDEIYNDLSHDNITKVEVIDKIFKSEFHGTILRISNLNDSWTLDDSNNLLKNLEVLIPSHINTAFSLYLYDLRNLGWGGKIEPIEYEDYDYKVIANFIGERNIDLRIERNELNVSLLETKYSRVFNRPEMQAYPYSIEEFRKGFFTKQIKISENVPDELVSCIGPFSFSFYFVKNKIKDENERDEDKKYPYNPIDSALRKAWIERFGGIRIYRDNFRVRPYGENGNDWLDLGRRQAKSPGGAGQKLGGYRVRPNQIAGAVNISRLSNKVFEDKSNREGIQETDAFIVFKNILLQIISAFEEDRNHVMFNMSEQYKEEHPATAKAQDIAKKVLSQTSKEERNSTEAQELKILAESYHSLESELHDKDSELAMLRGLASLGISVATFTHELRSIMERLIPRNEDLKKILLKNLPEDLFEDVVRFENPYRQLDIMHDEDEKLYSWLRYSLNSIQRSKRDWSKISLDRYFKFFIESWALTLSKKSIFIDGNFNALNGCMIEGIEMDLDSIFNNYISNSISAFLNSNEEHKLIKIVAYQDHGFAIIDFIDNGVGLAQEYRDNPDIIFNAFETSKVDKKNNKVGTGMGLFIAKGVVSMYQGAAIAILPVSKGFGIRTIFKIIRYEQ
ncbi:MAG: ATP-binding protein [archaeon]|nr:ATP-binding protein [archaeon]